MSELLLDRLRRKLGEAFAENWRYQSRADAVLDQQTAHDEAAGGLVGGITFRVQDSSARWHSVHYEPMGVLTTPADLDDWLARGLSQFLMKHPTWPK